MHFHVAFGGPHVLTEGYDVDVDFAEFWRKGLSVDCDTDGLVISQGEQRCTSQSIP